MKHNYHTHTARCKHASGTEREYVENAIQAGMETLGFSDHAPYVFPDTDYYSWFRMGVEEIHEYAETIRALAKEYEKDIRILCGFELEYYPDYHKEEMEFLSQVHPDYLLLGQHFLGNENSCKHVMSYASDDTALSAYVTQALAGLATGDFLYLAHPDLMGTEFTPEVVEREFRRLCEGAKRRNIPLEINLLGMQSNRQYPTKTFFKIAGEVGNDIILGADAHTPQGVHVPELEAVARQWVDEFDLHLIEKLI